MALSEVIEDQLKSPNGFIQAKTVNTFVLDSDDFRNLRAYLVAASLFPHNEATFATIYPKALLTKYVPAVDYDDLKTNLPIIHDHCITFRTNTIAPLIVLAADIVNFADRTTTRFNEIHDELTVILDNVDARKVADSHGEVVELLKRLSEDAGKMRVSCGELRNGLAKFREITLTDKKTITRLDKKLTAHEKNARESMHTVTEKQKKDQAEAKKETVKVDNPVESTGFMILASIMPGGIFVQQNLIKELMKQHMAKVLKYSTLLATDQAKLANLEACLSLTQALAKQVSDVDSAIQGALNAVLNLSGTCAHMEAQFKALTVLITLITPGQRRVLKDLKALVNKWEKVKDVAQSFGSAGILEIAGES